MRRKEYRDQFQSCFVASFQFDVGLSAFFFLSTSCSSLFLLLFPFIAEGERIRKCKGRVFALQDEPEVARVWLPNNDSPGLAMARAFGDFCLKDFGLISVRDISYRRITEKDEFIVFATDGVGEATNNPFGICFIKWDQFFFFFPAFCYLFIVSNKIKDCLHFSADLGCAIKQRGGRHYSISPSTVLCGSVPG